MSLNEDQRKEFYSIFKSKSDLLLDDLRNELEKELSSKQKLQVRNIFATGMASVIAILSVAGFFIISGIATKVSQDVSKQEIENQVSKIQTLREDVRTLIVPPGAVVAFERDDGCPLGWIEHINARSRVIVGATPENAEADGLLDHHLNQKGGSESYTPSYEESAVLLNERFPNDAGEVSVASGGDYVISQITLEDKSSAFLQNSHSHRAPFLALLYCRKQ